MTFPSPAKNSAGGGQDNRSKRAPSSPAAADTTVRKPRRHNKHKGNLDQTEAVCLYLSRAVQTRDFGVVKAHGLGARDKQISWYRDAIFPNRSHANPVWPTPNRTGLTRSRKQLPPESTFRPDTLLASLFT